MVHHADVQMNDPRLREVLEKKTEATRRAKKGSISGDGAGAATGASKKLEVKHTISQDYTDWQKT
jgi:hypothetical protein